MHEIAITWRTILAALAGIAAIVAGLRALDWLIGPVKRLRAKVDSHDTRLDRDHARLNSEEESTKAMMGALLALLNHTITGNSIDGLKSARDRLQAHLVQK